jgi:hypothetical protein
MALDADEALIAQGPSPQNSDSDEDSEEEDASDGEWAGRYGYYNAPPATRTLLDALHYGFLKILGRLDAEQINARINYTEDYGDGSYERSYDNLLHYALSRMSSVKPHVVAFLLENGSTIPEGILTTVAHMGQVELLRLLMKHGADVNYRDEECGTTALFPAMAHHTPELAAVLLRAGAEVNAYRAVPQLMLRQDVPEGYESEEEDMNSPTPLMCCAKASISCELFRLLLARGADFNRRDRARRTVEHYVRSALEEKRWDQRHVFQELPDTDDEDAWYMIREQEARLAGEGERMLDLLQNVRRAGSWMQLLVLQKLCLQRRATAPRAWCGSSPGRPARKSSRTCSSGRSCPTGSRRATPITSFRPLEVSVC